MRISFYGACGEVTGSNILLETSGKKIILDCGIFQGYKLSEERNWASFGYDPASCDCAVICHAHLDHTGRLPKLVKEGFCGPIYSTGPTKELAYLVLEDSEKLMREESKRDNRPPLYTKADIEKVMELFRTISYEEKIEITEGVELTFKNAGHILGSAIAVIEADGKKLVYTSDLGNNPSLLLEPPEFITCADYVICESTYGGRVHEDPSQRREKLAQIINATIAQNGVLMIPSFAIERTQELLHDIDHFCGVGNCTRPLFFLDSPLAEKITKVFEKYPEYLSKKLRREHPDNDFFASELFNIISTVEESKAIRVQPNPKVIIAGSGMMNGGRILFHLRDYLGESKNCLLIVGYQAKGTLGRKIFEGEKFIKILGKKIEVKAQVKAIGSYSAHADLPQLSNWLSKIGGLQKVFAIHGEEDQAQSLAKTIKAKLNIETEVPQQGESYIL